MPNPFAKSPQELIPLELLLTLAISAKMKIKTSMTDIPYAIEDAELLAQLGFNLVRTPDGETKKLVTEEEYRYLFEQYSKDELVKGYNECVQQHILPKAEISSQIHILDCTKIEVTYSNTNYEGATVVRDDEGRKRGYKLGTLRGVVGDSGVIEELCFGTISEHDVKLCETMLLNSPVLKYGDSLINDRGFISRKILNSLKTDKGVDTYVPAKKSMDIYTEAVLLAKMPDTKWTKHPNKKRKTQEIAFIDNLGIMWQSSDPQKDVPLNACVVHDAKDDDYYVFVTTDTTKTARQIILTYEIRPEIEEDYRQLEGFKSTKLSLITFHIICTLLGYLLFQLYVGTAEGEKYVGEIITSDSEELEEQNTARKPSEKRCCLCW